MVGLDNPQFVGGDRRGIELMAQVLSDMKGAVHRHRWW